MTVKLISSALLIFASAFITHPHAQELSLPTYTFNAEIHDASRVVVIRKVMFQPGSNFHSSSGASRVNAAGAYELTDGYAIECRSEANASADINFDCKIELARRQDMKAKHSETNLKFVSKLNKTNVVELVPLGDKELSLHVVVTRNS